MPASAVTSVNSIGPEGRGGVGLGDGDATAAAVSVAGAAGTAVGACLHPDKTTTAKKKVNNNLLVLSNFVLSNRCCQLLCFLCFFVAKKDLDQHRCWSNQE